MARDNRPAAAVALGRASIPFVETPMERDPGTRYEARLLDGTLAVRKNGDLLYALPGRSIVERFVDGTARPQGRMPHPTRVARFIGNDAARHHSDLRTYAQVALGEVFPGIDVSLRATGDNVEKVYNVRAGANPRGIRMAIDGVGDLRVDDAGAMHARTRDGGEVTFTAPVAYQSVGGEQRPVPVAYALGGRIGSYGFAVGTYDPRLPLVIDPFAQATYAGGTADDGAVVVTIHPQTAEVIVAGYTYSSDFPCTTGSGGCPNGAQPAFKAASDAFIARFSPDLKELRQATYLGGNGEDPVAALAVDPGNGDIIAAGITNSTDFPCTTPGGNCAAGAQQALAGPYDGYLARLSPDLTQLKQATYFGGSGYDNIAAVVVHPLTGEVFAAGATDSVNLPCTAPLLGGSCAFGAQSVHANDGGSSDGFVVRFSPDLQHVHQATYFGAEAFDSVTALAIHPATGDVIIAGGTKSASLPCSQLDPANFCTYGAQYAHASDSGATDGFVARLTPDLFRVIQSTFIGGDGNDFIYALAVDPASGDLFVAGATNSTNFPCATRNLGYDCQYGAQSSRLGTANNGFVARLTVDLRRIIQSTYLGGNGETSLTAVTVHPWSGEIFVGGYTMATDLPCTNGIGCEGAQSANAGLYDGVVARLPASLTYFAQVTYVGGSGNDQLRTIAIDARTGFVVGAGMTGSVDLPCTTAGGACGNGARPTHASGAIDDAFAVRMTPDLTLSDTTPAPFAFAGVANAPRNTLITSAPVRITDFVGTIVAYVEGPAGSSYCISLTNDCSCSQTSGGFTSQSYFIADGDYVCLRTYSSAAPDQVTTTTFHVGPAAAKFRVATGALPTTGGGGGCTLDVDGNGTLDARFDGLMLMRAMFGFTGTAVTNNAVGANAARTTWAQIGQYLNRNCGAGFAP